MNEYKCSFDLWVVVRFIFIAGLIVFGLTVKPMLSVLLILVGILYYFAIPTSVTVSDEAIILNRKINPRTFDFSNIKSIKRVSFWAYAFSIAIKMHKVTSQYKNFIRIENKWGNVMFVTPDDPDGLLADVRQKYPSLFFK